MYSPHQNSTAAKHQTKAEAMKVASMSRIKAAYDKAKREGRLKYTEVPAR